MKKISSEAEKIMMERFGKDTVIALATVEDGVPYVRSVNAYYENGSFYIITYTLSLTVDFPLPMPDEPTHTSGYRDVCTDNL